MIFRIPSSLVWVALLICLSSYLADATIPAERYGYLNLTRKRTSLADVNGKLQESTQEKSQNIVASNFQLCSLTGSDNLSMVGDENLPDIGSRIHIDDNWTLTDFCALTNLFTNRIYNSVSIKYNQYNPTIEDIKESQYKL